MERIYKTILLILNLFFTFTIISIPTFILLAEYSHLSRFDKSLTHTYSPTTPPSKSELNLNADIGRINIDYTNQTVDDLVRVDIFIEMGGPNLDGKSYLDFFNIVWQNTSSIINLTVELKPGMDQFELVSLIKNVSIIVTLRRDVIFDININSKIQGDVKIIVPWNTSVGNILTNISSGDIQYDFSFCTIDGNITAKTKNGNIILDSDEARYHGNSIWSLFSEVGNIYIDLNQENDVGANITGTISTLIGNYRISYVDYTKEVGALFILHVHQDDWAIHQQLIEIIGFEFNLTTINGNDIYSVFSNDFLALNNYNLTFTMPAGIYEDLYLRNLLN